MLADYLERPQLAKRFDMMDFESDKPCGTAACAVGHGPYAGILKSKRQNWMDYSFKFIPKDKCIYDKEGQTLYWSFAFDSDWTKIDNTPIGAAKRIRWMLEGKEVPEQFEHFMRVPDSERYRMEMKKWYVDNITKLSFL